MQIKEGKFYRTRDGRKVGPMVLGGGGDGFPWTENEIFGWWSHDGKRQARPFAFTDLVSEWTDAHAEPKLWRDMTPEEKGALLLAHHEGKVIETRYVNLGGWSSYMSPLWCEDWAYRVKPEPERKTITARVCITDDGYSVQMVPNGGKEYGEEYHYAELTFDVVDGKMIRSTARVEPLE